MNTRIKRTGAVLKSRAEMEAIVGEVRQLKIEEQSALARKNAELQKLDEHYSPLLQQIGKDIEQRVALVQAWAEANPDEFGNRKSIETQHGTIGFRTGTPKLKTLLKWTWARVLEALDHVKWGEAFIRVKRDVDREGIIAGVSSGALTNDDLRRVGVCVVQEESFYIETRLAEVEARESREAA